MIVELKELWKNIKKILKSRCGEGHIPDYVVRNIAKALLPNILAFFESEKGRKEFERWKTEQKKTMKAETE